MKKYNQIILILLAKFFLALNFIGMVKEVFLQDSGVDAEVIILTGFFYQISKTLFEIPTGRFADRYGYKRSVGVGIIVQATSILIMATATNITALLTFILFGFGNTFISGALDALLYEKITEAANSIKYKIVNYTQYIDMGSRSMALVITPFMVTTLGYRFVIILSIISLLISFICIMTVQEEEPKGSESKSEKVSFGDMLSNTMTAFIDNSQVIGHFLIRKSFTVFDIPLEKFAILIFIKKGFSFEIASSLFAASLLLYPVFSSISNHLPIKDSDRWLIWSPLIADLCIVVFLFSNNTIVSLLAYFGSSLVISTSSIHYFMKTNDLIDNKHRATILSIDSLILTFTAAIMYLIMALLNNHIVILSWVVVIFVVVLNWIGRRLIRD
ncbi:MFS transporter [Mollicutes bacterium LVI A0039]|nr:MFS transporter [Mollicutes bacterium LVI A0039]